MLLFTVVYDNECEEIIEGLSSMKEYFAFKKIGLGVSESIVNHTHFIKIFCNDEDFNSALVNQFNLKLAGIVYDIAVREFYNKEMAEFIMDTYFFLKNDELKIISKKCLSIFKNQTMLSEENMIYFTNRKNSAIRKIVKVLEENKEINIKGFITFRMKDLREDLENIIDKVVEKYMVEKEYDEFIKLLKYFVDIQESKLEELNLIVAKDGSYLLKDKYGVEILYYLFGELSESKISGTVTTEDMLISVLITNAPARIIIHSVENCSNKELIETIKSVFEDKVTFCNECAICDEIKHSLKI